MTLPLSDVIYGSLLTGNDVCPTIMEESMSMENFSNCRRFRNIAISHSHSRNVFCHSFWREIRIDVVSCSSGGGGGGGGGADLSKYPLGTITITGTRK